MGLQVPPSASSEKQLRIALEAAGPVRPVLRVQALLGVVQTRAECVPKRMVAVPQELLFILGACRCFLLLLKRSQD